MYLPNFLDGFDRLVAFDAETTGKRTFDVLGVEVASLDIRIERLVIVGDKLLAGLIIEAVAKHIHEDDVLPVSHEQTRRACAIEYRAPGSHCNLR